MTTHLPTIFPALRAPTDEEGYVVGFEASQIEEMKQFFDTYGFVVVKNVLTKEECEASVDDIFNYLESGRWKSQWVADIFKPHESEIKREDITTWETRYWPWMSEEGIIGPTPVFTKQALTIRQHPKIYQVFCDLLGVKTLWVNQDRYGFFRPTENIKWPNETAPKNKSEWKTSRNLHFDRNPWRYFSDNEQTQKALTTPAFPSKYNCLPAFCTEYNEEGHHKDGILKLQGLINFVDNKAEDGGFQLVPGFHKHSKNWAKAEEALKKSRSGTFVIVPRSDAMHKQAQRITVRAGSMIIWPIEMPHGSAPNASNKFRLCQFVKMFPEPPFEVPSVKNATTNRKAVMTEILTHLDFQPSELGAKLFGVKAWSE